jgi:hypothetical protein
MVAPSLLATYGSFIYKELLASQAIFSEFVNIL